MKKTTLNINEIKQRITDLKGKEIKLAINRGRKRIEKYNAMIENIYPSVFTARLEDVKTQNIQTFSYSDVLCGDVKIL